MSLKENPFKGLYRKDYIRNSIKNLINLVEEKGIKCRLEKRIDSAGEYNAEIIAVKCVDHTTFPTSEVTVPIIWEQELEEMCDCKTIKHAKEYLYLENSGALIDMVFEWIRCLDCCKTKLWQIIKMLNLDKIIKQVELYRINPTEL